MCLCVCVRSSACMCRFNISAYYVGYVYDSYMKRFNFNYSLCVSNNLFVKLVVRSLVACCNIDKTVITTLTIKEANHGADIVAGKSTDGVQYDLLEQAKECRKGAKAYNTHTHTYAHSHTHTDKHTHAHIRTHKHTLTLHTIHKKCAYTKHTHPHTHKHTNTMRAQMLMHTHLHTLMLLTMHKHAQHHNACINYAHTNAHAYTHAHAYTCSHS